VVQNVVSVGSDDLFLSMHLFLFLEEAALAIALAGNEEELKRVAASVSFARCLNSR